MAKLNASMPSNNIYYLPSLSTFLSFKLVQTLSEISALPYNYRHLCLLEHTAQPFEGRNMGLVH